MKARTLANAGRETPMALFPDRMTRRERMYLDAEHEYEEKGEIEVFYGLTPSTYRAVLQYV